jgi:hypothetical protein
MAKFIIRLFGNENDLDEVVALSKIDNSLVNLNCFVKS